MTDARLASQSTQVLVTGITPDARLAAQSVQMLFVPDPPADPVGTWGVNIGLVLSIPPWRPDTVTGLVAWYDADDASTFTFSSGAVVSQWRDKSGNGRHFAQATVANQPTRGGTQNGRATLVFDGSNDYMDTAAFTLAQPFTVLFAAKAAASSGYCSSVGGSLQIWTGTNYMQVYGGTVLANASYTSGQANQWSVIMNGSSTKVYRDGTLAGTGNAGTSGTTTGLRLAERNLDAATYMHAPMFEMCIYDRILTDPERQQVEGYLKTKWGLP